MRAQKIAFFIDDDQDFLELIHEAIHHPKFEIKTLHVDNGYHAIDEIIKLKPDLLFIDFYLPRINGSQILPILKHINFLSEAKIYFVTGFQKDDIQPFIQDSCAGILMKGDSLREEVMKVLDQENQLAA